MLLGTNKIKVKTKAPKSRGYIMYQGPSMLTGGNYRLIVVLSDRLG